MSASSRRILLVNPWITDFSAYDFWTKPLGLLRLGGLLREWGFEIDLLDCLDRRHPALDSWTGVRPADHADGTGKFIRQPIEKPAALHDIPRLFSRYGLPIELVTDLLAQQPRPDAIFLTSMMTYWYPAVVEMAALLRSRFPGVPLVLGGVYATLCSTHARDQVRPDFLVVGEGERHLPQILYDLFGCHLPEAPSFDHLPMPGYDLYLRLDSLAIETTRGCPFSCNFCASHLLAPHFQQRTPASVAGEIRHWHETRGIRHLAFYDDALLVHPERSIKPLLRLLIDARPGIRLHLPNGIHPRQIDAELAVLFQAAGVQTIRLSFESSRPERAKEFSHKVTPTDLANAVQHLHAAGYRRDQIGAYVILGLPQQSMQEVQESCLTVNRMGVRVYSASFSPIPGTASWAQAVQNKEWDENSDLLLSNNSTFPLWRRRYGIDLCQDLMGWIKNLNQKLVAE